tara:strand:- start:12826 stop:13452 length:627 start_codon:yes stop_codon:yes gene_type:complete
MKILCAVLISVLSFVSFAEENSKTEVGYISDNLMTYMHSGPGMNYRIIGRVYAGRRISVTHHTENGFTQILNDKGQLGWVETSMITANQTFRYKIDKLVKEKEAATTKVRNVVARADTLQKKLLNDTRSLTDQLQRAKTELSSLRLQFSSSERTRESAERSLAMLRDDLRGTMWRQGAWIALISLIFGFLMAFLPRPTRRKNSKRWMS